MRLTAKSKVVAWPTPLKTGLHDVRLRVTYNRTTRYYSLGLSAPIDAFDKAKGILVPSSRYPTENTLIESVKARAAGLCIGFSIRNETFNFEDFERQMFAKPHKVAADIAQFIKAEGEALLEAEKISAGNTRIYAAVAISRFGQIKTFDNVNPDTIGKFVDYLKAEYAGSTCSLYYTYLRQACRLAVLRGIMPQSFRPFDNVPSPKFDKVKTKRAINMTTIKAIAAKEMDGKDAFLRDLFVLSFLLRGMNLADIARLKKSDVSNGRLTYKRSKTKHSFDLKVTPTIQAIFDRNVGRANFMLPILKAGMTEKQVVGKIAKTGKKINGLLAVLCQEFGAKKMTFYAARHTYATEMNRMDVPKARIQEALGHSNMNTTELYLAGFDTGEMDEMDDKVYGLFAS